MILLEESQLYKGVFWVPDIENPDKNYCFKIECNSEGTPSNSTLELNAKSGTTYNHKLLWAKLPKSITKNKPYNYYPRGRVEISNGVAKIFYNGNLNTEDIVEFLKDEYNLRRYNGIKKVQTIVDNSKHYLCYLDDGWEADN